MRRRFQRARRPEEKEVRRQAILKAARLLLGKVATSELSLSELARRSGVSKANIYRYFESREDVLLHVWIEEVRALSEKLERAFAELPPGDADGVVDAMVKAFAAQPKLCELTSIASSVLERHLSTEAIISAKQNLATLVAHISELLHARIPAIPLEDCAWLASAVATWVAGIWPAVNPPPAVTEALSRPEFAAMRVDFERDFARVLKVLVKGLTSQ
jgi:AcrR family transcriptional regulator